MDVNISRQTHAISLVPLQPLWLLLNKYEKNESFHCCTIFFWTVLTVSASQSHLFGL